MRQERVKRTVVKEQEGPCCRDGKGLECLERTGQEGSEVDVGATRKRQMEGAGWLDGVQL